MQLGVPTCILTASNFPVTSATICAAVSDEYIGCFQDTSDHFLTDVLASADNGMTIEKCRSLAVAKGYIYYGLQAGSACFGGVVMRAVIKLGDDSCNIPCAGNGNQTCGATSMSSVYNILGEACTQDSCSLLAVLRAASWQKGVVVTAATRMCKRSQPCAGLQRTPGNSQTMLNATQMPA